MKFSGVLRRTLVVGMLMAGLPGVASADQWMKPTAEELAMKSVPGYPNLPAIYLFREEITKDDLHVVQHYERIKILSEKGKEYANVELGYASASGDGYVSSEDKSIGDISGRTIHPDGTIIPFTGKPYLKTIEKTKDYKVESRVFTLPDVEVGSIIEYRYATRYSDYIIEAPEWYIQGPLFMKAAHYAWYPTTRELTDNDGKQINSITWFPILPAGVQIEQKPMPRAYEVSLKDVPPAPEEDYMPPIKSFTYRVLFSFSPYRSPGDFWSSLGKNWSKRANSFIGPDGALTAATQPIVAGANTQDEKLRKIYAAIMNMENTDYTRDRDKKEDKAAGLKQVKTAVDVLRRERGNSEQLSFLFIGMARAAGMKAYAMQVPNRNRHMFVPEWLNMYRQFSNTVAIVNVDGKEMFFAPGERYTPYGHLEWEYTIVQGLRQTDTGTAFASTPSENYKQTKTARVANLTMAGDGTVAGKLDMTYEGATALRWRQEALRGDEEGFRKELKKSMEEMVPKTLEVSVLSIENLKDYEKPLKVSFEAKGMLGTSTGKRMLMPIDPFVAGDTAAFPHERRELPVYFHYPQTVLDAYRINLPPSVTVEAVPPAGQYSMKGLAAYGMTTETAPHSVTVRRSYLFGDIIVPVAEYPALRTFYSQLEAKDQETMVLKVAAAPASAAATAAAN